VGKRTIEKNFPENISERKVYKGGNRACSLGAEREEKKGDNLFRKKQGDLHKGSEEGVGSGAQG